MYKRIYSVRIRDFGDPEVAAVLLELGNRENDALRSGLEQQIAEEVHRRLEHEVHSHEVIIHAFSIGSVRSSSRNDEESIPILTRLGRMPFEEASALFASIDERYKEGFVEVYAPVGWDTRADRARCVTALEEPVREILLRHARRNPAGLTSEGGS